jgi:hypothetical protein
LHLQNLHGLLHELKLRNPHLHQLVLSKKIPRWCCHSKDS